MNNSLEELFNKAQHFLSENDFLTARTILTFIEQNVAVEESANLRADGYDNASIDLSNYYLHLGSLLSAFPEKESEAVDAFCKHTFFQPQVDNTKKIEGTQRFYSFRKPNDYSYADLANDTITVVSPLKMNDPFDTLMYPWLDARKTVSEEKIQSNDFSNEYEMILRRVGRLFEESQRYYRIRSFCAWKKGDKEAPYKNTLMWSHYADSHKGFCVVYNFSADMRFKHCEKKGSYRVLCPIHYEEENIDLKTKESIDGETVLLTKSKPWQYEQEYRLLIYDPSIKEDFYPLGLDQESSIYAIIFGLKCEDSTKSIVKGILRGKDVLYYQIKENLEDIYTLDI